MVMTDENHSYDCNNCPEQRQKAMGCHEPVKRTLFRVDGEDIHRCPIKLIPNYINEILSLYSYYSKGHLPYNTGILDIPNVLYESFLIIDNKLAEHKRKELERQQKRNNNRRK